MIQFFTLVAAALLWAYVIEPLITPPLDRLGKNLSAKIAAKGEKARAARRDR